MSRILIIRTMRAVRPRQPRRFAYGKGPLSCLHGEDMPQKKSSIANQTDRKRRALMKKFVPVCFASIFLIGALTGCTGAGTISPSDGGTMESSRFLQSAEEERPEGAESAPLVYMTTGYQRRWLDFGL